MKLTYKNDQQLVNDAARLIIENHLHWSNSNESSPSKGQENVRGQVFEAYRKAQYSIEEWSAMSDARKELEAILAGDLFEQAAQLADRKWEAAMTLLGIEQ